MAKLRNSNEIEAKFIEISDINDSPVFGAVLFFVFCFRGLAKTLFHFLGLACVSAKKWKSVLCVGVGGLFTNLFLGSALEFQKVVRKKFGQWSSGDVCTVGRRVSANGWGYKWWWFAWLFAVNLHQCWCGLQAFNYVLLPPLFYSLCVCPAWAAHTHSHGLKKNQKYNFKIQSQRVGEIFPEGANPSYALIKAGKY